MNNKGFTLVELLAVIAILALVGILTAPSVLNSLDLGKKTSDEVLINNVRVALQTMYEEARYSNSQFYEYDLSGLTSDLLSIGGDDPSTVNLQTLVGNGFLTGVNNNNIPASCPTVGTGNCNKKIILNSENEDLGMCEVTIEKVSAGSKICYKISSDSSGSCPTTEDFGGDEQCS